MACLVEMVEREQYRITSRGTEVLQLNPQQLDVSFLKTIPEFMGFQRPKSGSPANAGGKRSM
jgi:restriction endonuclease Mrr